MKLRERLKPVCFNCKSVELYDSDVATILLFKLPIKHLRSMVSQQTGKFLANTRLFVTTKRSSMDFFKIKHCGFNTPLDKIKRKATFYVYINAFLNFYSCLFIITLVLGEESCNL